jgi:hypothetical protein
MPKLTVAQLIEKLQEHPEWADWPVLVHDGLDPSDLQPVERIEEIISVWELVTAGLAKGSKAIALK